MFMASVNIQHPHRYAQGFTKLHLPEGDQPSTRLLFEEKKGDILARMSGDVSEVENSVISSLDSIQESHHDCGVFYHLVDHQLAVTLFVLFLSPVALFLWEYQQKLKRPSREGQAQWGELLSK